MNRAVFLDRDGVLNRSFIRDGKPYPPASLADAELVPEAPEALAKLKAAGFLLIVVTNQPDVARGTQTKEVVEEIHRWLAAELPLDGFQVCYHDAPDACDCRKPQPGMLLRAAAEHALRLNDSFLIGDRWRDVEAGRAAGVRTVFIDYGYEERRPNHPPDAIVKTVLEAADWILGTK